MLKEMWTFDSSSSMQKQHEIIKPIHEGYNIYMGFYAIHLLITIIPMLLVSLK